MICFFFIAPEEPVIDKSINAIHNPHPYMAEYEEQLIEGANMEGSVDEYYAGKDERVVEPEDKGFSDGHQTGNRIWEFIYLTWLFQINV